MGRRRRHSLIGGSGANVFAFAHGGASAGGNDSIGNWTANDTLALIGYAANGGFSQTRSAATR